MHLPTHINCCNLKHLFLGWLVLAFSLSFAGNAFAVKLYKWVDEDGKVFYSDKIPPKANEGAHSRLNEKGLTIEEKEAAKTADEIRKEQELEKLRKEKEAVIAKQKAQDRVLLKTFRSEDDMLLARDGKIRSVDNYINITRGNIKRLKEKLAIMQSQAADLEKSGKTVNQKFKDDMDAIKRQINQSYSSIVAREQNKEEIRGSYDNDIRRFRVLKKLKANNQLEAEAQERAELNTVFICPDINQCNLAWNKAIDYVKTHATTKLQLLGEGIYMTRAPTADEDVSLTVARIKNKKTQEEKIFLDQQCRTSILGQEFCKSEASKELKRNFIPYLLGQK
jgi:hypothetical protein